MHKQLLTTLSAFHHLCQENAIAYSLHGGTLLGAVRNQGFIPWDDDADVAMTRPDFLRLCQALEGTPYGIRGDIKKQFYLMESPEIWVDIFLCDPISHRRFPRMVKQLVLTGLDIMHRDAKSRQLSNLEQYGRARRLVFTLAYTLGQIVPKKWTAAAYQFVARSCLVGNRETLFRSNDQYAGRKLMFPARWMTQYQALPFETEHFSAVTAWHQLLCQCYGPDYLTPRREDRNTQIHNRLRGNDPINL